MRFENQRRGISVVDGGFQVAVQGNMHWFGAMAALGADFYGQGFFAELPLHEGRRDGVLRSGRVDDLSGAELQLVRGRRGGDRISPEHRALWVAKQKEQILFQVIENGFYLFQG